MHSYDFTSTDSQLFHIISMGRRNRSCNINLQGLLCLLFSSIFVVTAISSLTQSARLAQIIQAQRLQLHSSCNVITGTAKQTKEQARTKNPKGYMALKVGAEFIRVKLYMEKKTWDDAQTSCQEDGGSLAKLDTRQIERSIVSLSGFAAVKTLGPWIGLSDLYDNDTYFWTDGTPTTYLNWLDRRPSHSYKGQKENCVIIQYSYRRQVVGWNDVYCWNKGSFICQIRSEK
ncbi:C-type lectin TsL-like [Haliotis rufescens]|uniref:C-type lectin TsL-like n=1 Tax=Haliotis rufescens TaxID=6454 RepID=UPI001EB0418F|nr:C-type lectin TsL-like [Haliotis rufescens]